MIYSKEMYADVDNSRWSISTVDPCVTPAISEIVTYYGRKGYSAESNADKTEQKTILILIFLNLLFRLLYPATKIAYIFNVPGLQTIALKTCQF